MSKLTATVLAIAMACLSLVVLARPAMAGASRVTFQESTIGGVTPWGIAADDSLAVFGYASPCGYWYGTEGDPRQPGGHIGNQFCAVPAGAPVAVTSHVAVIDPTGNNDPVVVSYAIWTRPGFNAKYSTINPQRSEIDCGAGPPGANVQVHHITRLGKYSFTDHLGLSGGEQTLCVGWLDQNGDILTDSDGITGTDGMPFYSSCGSRVFYYSSRGSSENAGLGQPGAALFSRLRAGKHVSLNPVANPYPAQAIDNGLKEDLLAFLAPASNYRQSVLEGVADGVSYLNSLPRAMGGCRRWAVVLVGYSQGADVTRRIAARLSPQVRRHVAAVILFGDPNFTPLEAGVQPFGAYPAQRNQYGVEGVALATGRVTDEPPPPSIPMHADSWCHAADAVCAFHPTIDRAVDKRMRTYYLDLQRGDMTGALAALRSLSRLADDAVPGHFTYDRDACAAARLVAAGVRAHHIKVSASC